MKTLILNGSTRRNGDTVALITELTKHLEGDTQVISYFDGIHPCMDCRYCWSHSGCAIKDKMQDIYPYVEECDNFVIASPIWFSELSGPLLNLASRMQTYFAARFFRKESSKLKHKNGVLMLAGAEPGTEKKAVSTAHTIFKHVNALPCVASIFSLKTDNVPASQDSTALSEIHELAAHLNRLYLQKS